MNDIIFCKNIVLNFLDTYGNGDINFLKGFDFSLLYKNRKNYDFYGEKSKKARYSDADDTLLIRCILYLLHHQDIQGLSFHDIGTGKKYRGDTMNSFRSLFKWYLNETQDQIHPILKENKESVRDCLSEGLTRTQYSKLTSNIESYLSTYHTLGNFILMPNHTCNKQTINTARGQSIYLQDFFDMFLNEVKNKLANSGSDRNGIQKFFHKDCCKEYLKESFATYCETYFLNMYISDNEIKYYKINNSSYPKKAKRWRVIKDFNDIEIQEYYGNSLDFINDATERIKKREELMLQRLNEILHYKQSNENEERES